MRRLAVVFLLLALSGCGVHAPPPTAGSPAEREWASAALQLLDGLDVALPRIRRAGVGPGTLKETSLLYEALLGYTYVDSCATLLGQLGEPSPRERKARDRMREACTHLHHASDLFTQAVLLDRSALLVTAASEALATAPLLHQARKLLTGAA